MNSIPTTLKDRAIQAHNEAQERKAHEQAEKEKQAKIAHSERLQTLCIQILQLEKAPWVQWVNGAPFADVDGMLFTCYREPLSQEPDGIYLRTFVHDGSQGAWRVCCLEDLGEFLKKKHDTRLARIEGNRIVPQQAEEVRP